MRKMIIIACCILLALLTLLATTSVWAAATTTPTTDLAQVRGSPPVATAMATSIQANAPRTADYLGTPTPTARTGPMALAVSPCAHDSGTLENTCCCDELHAYPVSPNHFAMGDRHINRTFTDHYYSTAAIA